MSEESDLEKTEEASPQRLEKAREKGQIARSRELSTAAVVIGGFATVWASSQYMYQKMAGLIQQGMTFKVDPKRLVDTGIQDATRVVGEAIGTGLMAIAPVWAALIVLAIGSSVALGGMVFSTSALSPNFSRLNVMEGIGRMFSSQTAIELLKTILKATMIGWAGYISFSNALPKIMMLSRYPIAKAFAVGLETMVGAIFVVVSSLLVIVLIDVPWQMMSHAKKLRMSKEELKQEHKEAEGDPHIKGRIRQQQREIARRRMMSDVPKADVVITNPTHYAVALKYDPAGNGAPVLLAKGKNAIAAKIRQIAEENKISTIEAPPLARAIYANVELKHPIPEELYTAVAQVLAWVFQLKKWNTGEVQVMPNQPRDVAVPPELDPENKGKPINNHHQ